MNDIPRFQDQLDGSIYGNPNFVGGGKSRVALIVEVVHTPPELLTDDFDADLRLTNSEQCP